MKKTELEGRRLPELGEEDGFSQKLRRLAKQNKLAVGSAVLILLLILAAALAPALTPIPSMKAIF